MAPPKKIPFHFTKVIATLGPASYSYAMIHDFVAAGLNVVRLNFSHGSHEDHAQAVAWVRQAEAALGTTVAVMADLQGPKFRLGDMAPLEVVRGQVLRLVSGPMNVPANVPGSHSSAPSDPLEMPFPHPEIFKVLKVGDVILVDDGKMRLSVLATSSDWCDVEALTQGPISARKGVNLPFVEVPTKALTPKDAVDLKAALAMGVDYVAVSFVQRDTDIEEVRHHMVALGRVVPIVAKLEKPTAINNLESIIDAADAVMIARGDLGVELPCEDVPPLQRRIIRACRQKGLPVVVATQMLESMIHTPTPTRAEASDVATAVYEGADAVMLSAESASGQYPLEALETMIRIITKVQQDPNLPKMLSATRPPLHPTVEDAISAAMHTVSLALPVAALAAFTEKGGTARRSARQRSLLPIVAITPHTSCARQLCLVWGVNPVITKAPVSTIDDVVVQATHAILDLGFGVAGEAIIVTAGMPFGVPGSTNLLRIATL